MRTFLRITAFFLTISLAGCAKLEHLQQLLTLKDLSDNKDQQTKYVDAREESIKKILEAAKNNQIDQYKTSQACLDAFGPPVFKRQAKGDNQTLSEWLYRRPTKYFGQEKVYLYFDSKGNLHHWSYIVPNEPPKES